MKTELLFFAFALLLALSCFIPAIAGKVRLPYTVMLASVGCFIGIVAQLGWFFNIPVLGDVLLSLHSMHTSSEMLLMIFLPILLFESSIAVNMRKLVSDLGPVIAMAVLAVFLTTLLVGMVLASISNYGLVACLLLGSIVATTDPAAVLGIFKEMGAPRRLITLLEGESLLNDAAALAMFSVLIFALSNGSDISGGAIFGHFLYGFVAGGIFGTFVGVLTCTLFRFIRGFPTAEITLTLCTAFITYIVGEQYLGVSGVVATVFSGLVVGNLGRTRTSPRTFSLLETSWGQFGFWANSFIFLFAAMLIPELVSGMTWLDVLYTIVLYVVVLLARVLTVFGVLPLMQKMGLASSISRSYKIAISWGGLRGAISLALALSVTEHFGIDAPIKNFITGATTLFVLSTLFVNGLSLRPLINYLKLGQLSPLENQLRNQALIVALNDSRAETNSISARLDLDTQALHQVDHIFAQEIDRMRKDSQYESLDRDDKIAIALAVLSSRESNTFYEMFNVQMIPPKVAQVLMNDAERLLDALLAGGRRAYVQTLRHDLHYTFVFKAALRLQTYFGISYFLSRALSLRLLRLFSKHSMILFLIDYCQKEVKELLGEEIANAAIKIQQARLSVVNDAIKGLELTYPEYVRRMRVHSLARLARSVEMGRYREMIDQAVISPEIYTELIREANHRWSDLSDMPPLDVALSPRELMKNIPIFADLDEQAIREVSKLLKSSFVLPNEMIYTRSRYMRSLYFIASGAVSLTLADDTKAELGTGQMFGEMILMRRQAVYVNVRSLAYTRLLTLTRRDLRILMKKYPSIRDKVNEVMQERIYAMNVWQEYLEQQRALQSQQEQA